MPLGKTWIIIIINTETHAALLFFSFLPVIIIIDIIYLDLASLNSTAVPERTNTEHHFVAEYWFVFTPWLLLGRNEQIFGVNAFFFFFNVHRQVIMIMYYQKSDVTEEKKKNGIALIQFGNLSSVSRKQPERVPFKRFFTVNFWMKGWMDPNDTNHDATNATVCCYPVWTSSKHDFPHLVYIVQISEKNQQKNYNKKTRLWHLSRYQWTGQTGSGSSKRGSRVLVALIHFFLLS